MPAPAERFQHAMVQRNNFNYFYVLMGQSSSSFLNGISFCAHFVSFTPLFISFFQIYGHLLLEMV
jgi:hypothetical protein